MARVIVYTATVALCTLSCILRNRLLAAREAARDSVSVVVSHPVYAITAVL